MFSMEALLLRRLINDQRETRDRIPTIDELIEQAEKVQRKRAAAEARAEQLKRRGAPDA